MSKPVILTGDRTTGPLHLGHYAGSLKNRLRYQETHEQFILLADSQALTDNIGQIGKVKDSVLEVAMDYLAVGIDPQKTTICLQSHLPALAELSMLYLNFVSVGRLQRNPTVKEEIRARGFDKSIPAGFLCYPAAQAADITGFKATVVPVGEDQVPMIEQTNEIIRKVNSIADRDLLKEVEAIVPKAGRLPGVDGVSKMSKSAGNSVNLSANPAEISSAVKAMYTDPNHLRVDDPGQVEGNVVFTYLDAFHDDVEEVEDLKCQYRRGGLGDVKLKSLLDLTLQNLLEPIRERRSEFEQRPDDVRDMVREGTRKALNRTEQTKSELFEGLGFFRL
ncbi:tryptophan--tRNA ligase [Hyphomonas sp.]|uniref:tryptophan--tRNA ligase n=1 Tax=Hyphomonas sp. TaxID=87 RepID=UPI003D2A995C